VARCHNTIGKAVEWRLTAACAKWDGHTQPDGIDIDITANACVQIGACQLKRHLPRHARDLAEVIANTEAVGCGIQIGSVEIDAVNTAKSGDAGTEIMAGADADTGQVRVTKARVEVTQLPMASKIGSFSWSVRNIYAIVRPVRRSADCRDRCVGPAKVYFGLLKLPKVSACQAVGRRICTAAKQTASVQIGVVDIGTKHRSGNDPVLQVQSNIDDVDVATATIWIGMSQRALYADIPSILKRKVARAIQCVCVQVASTI